MEDVRKDMEKYYNTSDGYLNHLNKKRDDYFDYYINFINKYFAMFNKALVLEIGCGDGYTTKILSDFYPNFNFIGTDISSKFIDYAKINFKGDNLKYEVQDSLNFSFDDNSFDIIISTDVVEHIPDVPRWLDESVRILKKDGLLIIVSGNHFTPIEPLKDILTFKTRPPFTNTYLGNFIRLFKNVSMSFYKMFFPQFIYRTPDLTKNADNGGDYDACYYANQMDLVNYLKKKDMKIINRDFRNLFSFWGGIGIVAKK